MPLVIERIGSAIWPVVEQLAFEDRLAFDDRGARAAALELFERGDGAVRNFVLGPFLQRKHFGVDRIAQVDVVERDVDRHGFDLRLADWPLRSITWLMPIEATRPQPNASANNSSDFGRMISP